MSLQLENPETSAVKNGIFMQLFVLTLFPLINFNFVLLLPSKCTLLYIKQGSSTVFRKRCILEKSIGIQEKAIKKWQNYKVTKM